MSAGEISPKLQGVGGHATAVWNATNTLFGNVNFSAGTTSGNFNSIAFNNANNVSFGLNGSVMTASVAPSAGAVTFSAGTTSGNLSSLVFSNSNNISFGLNGSTITGSFSQTNQTIGIYASSNTTGQSSSFTVDARSLSIVGYGIVSVGMSGNSILISSPATTTFSPLSAGISTNGNTAGTTGFASNQIVLVGGNNITLSQSVNGGSATLSVIGPNVNFSAGTTSNNLNNLVFSNSNGVSFGLNGSTITGSVPATSSLSATGIVSLSINGNTISIGASQSNQTGGAYFAGNTTGQSSTSTFDARSLSFSVGGDISLGWSNGSIYLTGPLGDFNGIGVSTGGNTAGNTGTISQQVVLVGSNNITLSQATGAGGLGTITIIGPSGGLGSVNFSAGTTSNNLGAVTFSNSNNVSFGLNGSVITGSIPTISGTGQVSVSTNGGTISIGVPSAATLSIIKPDYWGNQGATQIGNGAVQIFPAFIDANFSASRADMGASFAMSTSSNSSFAGTISVAIGLYTRNGSTLSLASSGSQSYAFTNTSNNSSNALTGIRSLSVPININAGRSDYWVGMVSNTASVGTNWFSASNMVFTQPAFAFQGLFGVTSASTNQPILGLGQYSTTSNALPGSIAFSNIVGTAGTLIPTLVFHNMTA